MACGVIACTLPFCKSQRNAQIYPRWNGRRNVTQSICAHGALFTSHPSCPFITSEKQSVGLRYNLIPLNRLRKVPWRFVYTSHSLRPFAASAKPIKSYSAITSVPSTAFGKPPSPNIVLFVHGSNATSLLTVSSKQPDHPVPGYHLTSPSTVAQLTKSTFAPTLSSRAAD